MGGLGSGIPGGAGEGVYIRIVADAEEADESLSKFEGSLDDVTHSFVALEGATANAATTGQEFSSAFDKAGDSTKNASGALDGFMVNATMAVSGLNQLTGSLYKTIGGLEAMGVINEKTARQWQENARMIEAFTGPLEFAISMVILYQAAVLAGFIPATTAATVSSLGFAGGMSAATASVGAFVIAAAPFVLAAFVIVGVVFLIMSHLEELRRGLDYVVDGFKRLAEIVSDASGSVFGLTSNITGLGDALTDNPVTKMLGKAGGAIF